MFSLKKHGYTYLIFLVLWILIGLHVGYRYISFSSSQVQGKGGTFVEATFHNINYLPYFNNNKEDIFYQSLLFNGCIYPSFSGTSIQYTEELCTVDTTDYKTFTVTPKKDIKRSDGKSFTLNDIYFTYDSILKNNFWNKEHLKSYKSISVVVDESDETLQVIFPKASIDNMIFFTNFILPHHLLANKSLETYFTTFYKHPVGTNCARLQEASHDKESIIFDLSECENIPLKFYQVKQFQNKKALKTYINKKPDTIDLIIDESGYTGYNLNKVVLNKFTTLFFNTEKLSKSLRKKLGTSLAKNIYTPDLEKHIIKDHFLFDSFSDGPTIQKTDFGKTEALKINNESENNTGNNKKHTLKILPKTLNRTSQTIKQTYFLPEEIAEKKTLKFTFDSAYDKVSVTLDNRKEYFPVSYNKLLKISLYNLNPTYRNIHTGKNIYTIKAYTNGQIVAKYTLVIYYKSSPENTTNPIPLAKKGKKEGEIDITKLKTLKVIYFDDITSNSIVSEMKKLFTKRGINDLVEFASFDDINTLNGKLESKDYDIAIRSVSMGLKKDISNLFMSHEPEINPSMYTNEALSLATNEYFLFKKNPTKQEEIKEKIDTLYRKDMPFVIIGKELSSLWINKTKNFTYPFRLYVLGRRKDFIKDLPIFQHFSMDRERFKDINNFQNFLRQRTP